MLDLFFLFYSLEVSYFFILLKYNPGENYDWPKTNGQYDILWMSPNISRTKCYDISHDYKLEVHIKWYKVKSTHAHCYWINKICISGSTCNVEYLSGLYCFSASVMMCYLKQAADSKVIEMLKWITLRDVSISFIMYYVSLNICVLCAGDLYFFRHVTAMLRSSVITTTYEDIKL